MFLLFLAYVGGILTILSPCILPVLPFVFARSGQPFRKSGFPLLAGMAVTFALVASLAAVGGGWAVRANQFGRVAALVLFGIFGLTLIFLRLRNGWRVRWCSSGTGSRGTRAKVRAWPTRFCSELAPGCSGRPAPGRFLD
jgi:cytochrome c biogenesis protein CcdA